MWTVRHCIRRTQTGRDIGRLSRLCAGYHSNAGCHGFRPTPVPDILKESEELIQNRISNANLVRLVTAYREHGHRKADIDPLKLRERCDLDLLKPDNYGFEKEDYNEKFKLAGIVNFPKQEEASLGEVISHLEKTYCGPLSVEVQQITDEYERLWLSNLVEESMEWSLQGQRQTQLVKMLLKSQAFDKFMSRKFVTVKRYGGEGAESMMGFFDEAFLQASHYGVEEVILGMPHRGRLCLLVGILEYPAAQMFSKMMGNSELPAGVRGTGDVLSHLTNSVDLDYGGMKPLHVTMLPNPSHLEAVISVACGKTRGRQLTLKDGYYGDDLDRPMGDKVLCIQVHGDASFSGQGIVQENFAMANLPHFTVGGSVHLIVNNQLGFTTPAQYGRSSLYTSDVGKMIGCPVIHVNGDYPEEVVRACRLAMEYRMKFRKDVIIDMMCYRQWGHNEIDDPSFTQPSMYDVINNRQSVPDMYADQLVEKGVVTQEELTNEVSTLTAHLTEQLKLADSCSPCTTHLGGLWSGLVQPSSEKTTTWDTGVPLETLCFVGAKSVEVPEPFAVHPHLKKTHVQSRLDKLVNGTALDWATAEALAFGSLLYQGYNIRLSGQDVGRGTFSHRHAMFVDQTTDEIFLPLNSIHDQQTGFLELANSPLSEEAVLGFEYGMSIENPRHLIVWEAQFGDFFNGAQIMIDTYVGSGETKWLLQSGLVMLLPHGYDGAGPDHSSARIERFLQLTDSSETRVDADSVNMSIAHPTTPAQYFHLLRRQMVRNFRKPLIVIAPKLLLRLPAATSPLQDMALGTHFKPVLGDEKVQGSSVRRVVFCSGKYFYQLDKQRQKTSNTDTAIVRLEALTPFPAEQIKQELRKFPKATEFVWSQEEHRNMGPWSFVAPRFENLIGVKLGYRGRQELATPAVGIGKMHSAELEQILNDTFASN